MRNTPSLSSLLFAAGLVGACQAFTGTAGGGYVADTSLRAAVMTQLVTDPAADLGRVEVDVRRGVAYLHGTVDSGDVKRQAEQIVRRVDGIKDVVNNLRPQGG